jgi:hypothetical protein
VNERSNAPVYMTALYPHCVDREREGGGEALGAACQARAVALGAPVPGPEVFEGRGAYGA